MPSLFESSMMLEALSGDSDRQCPQEMREYREKAARDSDKWKWSIAEAGRRAQAVAWSPILSKSAIIDGAKGDE